MKNMKVLKEDPHFLDTEDRSFELLHALHGYQALSALHHEGHEVHEGSAPPPWVRRIEASHLFMIFMVDSLAWRLPILFMVRSVQSQGSVLGGSEVSANC